MSLRIRRGTDNDRQTVTLDQGELVYATDTHKVFVGDGVTQGGLNILQTMAGTGLVYDHVTQTLQATAVTGITSVSADATPSLGGTLSLNGHGINGTGTISTTGSIAATGSVQGGSVTATTTIATGSLTIDSTSTIVSTANVPHTSERTDNGIVFGTTSTPATLWMESSQNFAYLNGITDGTNNSGITSRISRGTLASRTAVQPGDVVLYLEGQGFDGTHYVNAGAIVLGVDPAQSVTSGHVPSVAGFLTVSSSGTPNYLTFNSTGVLTTPSLSVGDGSTSHPSIVFTTDGGQDSGFFHPGDGIVCVAVNATEKARFDSGGLRVNGFVKVAQVSGTLPSPAEAGMIVLDGTTFKGYNGTSWVALN
jgi:hypothetical protein